MKTEKTGAAKTFRLFGESVLFFLIQSAVLFFLDIAQLLCWYVFGMILYAVTKGTADIQNLATGISYGIIAVLYALLWLAIWKIDRDKGARWFPAKLLFAELPLLLGLWGIPKTPDPGAMISFPPEPLFAAMVTAVLLFPVYSALLRKFSAGNKERPKRRFLLLCAALLPPGLAIFWASWNVMHRIYRF